MENFDTNNKWQKHEQFVEQLLNIQDDEGNPVKYMWVDKNPQSGFTTSLGKVCVRKGLKFLEIAPYNRIIDVTLGLKIMDGNPYGKIGTNKDMCDDKYENPFFKGIYHTKCHGCKKYCGYRKVANIDYPAYGITYSKLDNTIRFPTAMGFVRDKIINKLFNETNVILLDEFANLITWLPKGFFVDDLDNIIELINQRKDILKVSPEIVEYLNKFITGIKNVEIDKERYDIKYGVYENEPLKMFGTDDITTTTIGVEGEKVIKNWARQTLKTFKDDVSCESPLEVLTNALMTMLDREIFVYNKRCKIKDEKTGQETEEIKRYALSNVTHPFDILKPYLEEYTKRGGKVIATGMILPPFETLPWKKIEMPDFNKSEKNHLIVCDTKNMGFSKTRLKEKCVLNDWKREKPKIQEYLLRLKKRFVTDKIIVFCFNKDIHDELYRWKMEKLGEEPSLEDIAISDEFCLMTYYGSDLNSGTPFNQRIKVYIGGAQTPNDAFEDAQLLYGLSHEKMRDMDIANRLVNALGRGKDPEGQQPSISFVIGCKMLDSIKVLDDGQEKIKKGLINLMDETMYHEKKEIIQVASTGTMYCLDRIFGYWWFARQKDINNLQEIPWFLDALRIAVKKSKNKEVIITKYEKIYDHWKRKTGFNEGVVDIRKIMFNNKKLLPAYTKINNVGIQITNSKNELFEEECLFEKKNDNENVGDE